MSHQFLTDRALAQSTAITPTTLIHIVTTGDTSQNSAGSSYKAELQQLIPIFSGSAGTSGVNGSSGTSGINGSSGTSGSSGVSGTSGIDGSSGTSGVSGTSGIDGSSGTSGLSFSGGSGNCITDLYVSNLYGCSPITVWDNLTLSGSVINSGNGGGELKFNYGFLGTDVILSDDNSSYTKGLLRFNGFINQTEISNYSGSVYSYSETNTLLENRSNQFYLSDNSVELKRFISSTDASRLIFNNNFGYPLIQLYSQGDDGKIQIGVKNILDVIILQDLTNNQLSANVSGPIGVSINSIGSTIFSGLSNTVILGGSNINATQSNTAYVDNLNIKTIGSGTSIFNLGLDSSGNVVTGATSSFTGGTVPGETIFTGGLSATTISATTIGSPTDCVDDLYVHNIHSCSPLNINPLDEGNVYFGSTSAVTIDLSNNRVGIGTTEPEFKLDTLGDYGRFYVSLDNQTVATSLSGSSSGQTDISVVSPGSGLLQLGIFGSNFTGTTSAGKVKDAYVYSSVANNGLNLVSAPSGGGLDDYIRFYAGQFGLTGNTPDIHIQGSGTTRGYVGINNDNPTYRLDISGTTGRVFYDGDTTRNTYRQSQIINEGPSTGITAISVASEGSGNQIELFSIGSGVSNSIQWRFVGEPSDVALYASSAANNLNIMNNLGSGTTDNIRFYAGGSGHITGQTPAMHIQGSGSTKGYVGIGTVAPTAKLHVSGDSLVNGTKTVTDRSNLQGGHFSFQGTDTAGGTYTDQWQKVCSFGNPLSVFDYGTFVIKVDVGGNTTNLNTSTDVNISYKQQSGSWYVYANIINYGRTPLISDNFDILLNTSAETITVYHKLTQDFDRPTYTYVGFTPPGLINYGTVVGPSLSGETNDSWTQKYVTNGLTSVVNTGYLGVGTTSPTAQLHVNNTGSTNSFLVEDNTNPDSSPFVIDSSGNVGIGISGTTYKLDVNGTTIHRDNVQISNTKEIFWSDTSTTWPTSINNRIRWTLNNDSAQVYAFQPESDNVDFVFKITDNATTSTDNFVFWIEDFSGETFDRYPLEMNGQNFIVNPTRRYALSASTSGAGNTDFYILQSGATALTQSVMFADVSTNRVGINNSSPSETLHVIGNTLISSGMSASTVTITNPYVPTGSTDPTGTAGTISWSGDTLYFKNNTGWVRITGQTSW